MPQEFVYRPKSKNYIQPFVLHHQPMTFTEAQTTVMGMRFCFFYFTYFSMSSTSCESLRSLSCKTIISFAINLSQSCSIPSLLITFSRQLEIVTAQLHCTCRFFHLYFNMLNSVRSEYIQTVHLNITLWAQIDDRV